MINLKAEIYNDHNSMQKRDSTEYFLKWKEMLDWGDKSGETIMDIGCGTGNSSTPLILSHFPNVHKIIATDGSKDMIRLAQNENPHPKIEYFVADIQDGSANGRWFGTASKVFSFFCLNWPKEQSRAFQNIHRLLSPGGTAALLFPLAAPCFDVNRSMKEDPKWKDIIKDIPCGTPDSHLKHLGASHFKKVFLDMGFDVILCEDEPRVFTFSTNEEIKGFLNAICPFLIHIPENLKSEFEQDLLKRNLKYCVRSPDGQLNFHLTILNAVLRKPLGIPNSFKMIHLDPKLIGEHHSLQFRDGLEFLTLCREELKWRYMTGETIMDVGCGTGNNTTKLILATYPTVEKIIATDGSEDMINEAEHLNSHSNIEYFVADIQEESVHRRWFGRVSKVISIHCFHWVKNQLEAFRNVFKLLKPGGEAAVIFVLNASNFDVRQEMIEDPKWREFTKGVSSGIPGSHTKKLDSSYYSLMVSDIGFELVLCKEEKVTFPFASDEKFKGFLTSVCPLLKSIPEDRRNEFEKDLLKRNIERCGRSPAGKPNFLVTNLTILLRKPSGMVSS